MLFWHVTAVESEGENSIQQKEAGTKCDRSGRLDHAKPFTVISSESAVFSISTSSCFQRSGSWQLSVTCHASLTGIFLFVSDPLCGFAAIPCWPRHACCVRASQEQPSQDRFCFIYLYFRVFCFSTKAWTIIKRLSAMLLPFHHIIQNVFVKWQDLKSLYH